MLKNINLVTYTILLFFTLNIRAGTDVLLNIKNNTSKPVVLGTISNAQCVYGMKDRSGPWYWGIYNTTCSKPENCYNTITIDPTSTKENIFAQAYSRVATSCAHDASYFDAPLTFDNKTVTLHFDQEPQGVWSVKCNDNEGGLGDGKFINIQYNAQCSIAKNNVTCYDVTVSDIENASYILYNDMPHGNNYDAICVITNSGALLREHLYGGQVLTWNLPGNTKQDKVTVASYNRFETFPDPTGSGMDIDDGPECNYTSESPSIIVTQGNAVHVSCSKDPQLCFETWAGAGFSNPSAPFPYYQLTLEPIESSTALIKKQAQKTLEDTIKIKRALKKKPILKKASSATATTKHADINQDSKKIDTPAQQKQLATGKSAFKLVDQSTTSPKNIPNS